MSNGKRFSLVESLDCIQIVIMDVWIYCVNSLKPYDAQVSIVSLFASLVAHSRHMRSLFFIHSFK